MLHLTEVQMAASLRTVRNPLTKAQQTAEGRTFVKLRSFALGMQRFKCAFDQKVALAMA